MVGKCVYNFGVITLIYFPLKIGRDTDMEKDRYEKRGRENGSGRDDKLDALVKFKYKGRPDLRIP